MKILGRYNTFLNNVVNVFKIFYISSFFHNFFCEKFKIIFVLTWFLPSDYYIHSVVEYKMRAGHWTYFYTVGCSERHGWLWPKRVGPVGLRAMPVSSFYWIVFSWSLRGMYSIVFSSTVENEIHSSVPWSHSSGLVIFFGLSYVFWTSDRYLWLIHCEHSDFRSELWWIFQFEVKNNTEWKWSNFESVCI